MTKCYYPPDDQLSPEGNGFVLGACEKPLEVSWAGASGYTKATTQLSVHNHLPSLKNHCKAVVRCPVCHRHCLKAWPLSLNSRNDQMRKLRQRNQPRSSSCRKSQGTIQTQGLRPNLSLYFPLYKKKLVLSRMTQESMGCFLRTI